MRRMTNKSKVFLLVCFYVFLVLSNTIVVIVILKNTVLAIHLYVVITLFWVILLEQYIISKRKEEASKAKKTFQSIFSKIFQLSTAAMSISSLDDGTIIDISDSFTKILGYEKSDLIGNKRGSLKIYAKNGQLLKIVSTLLEKDQLDNEEIELKDKEGKIHYGIYSARIITVNDEKCIFSSFTDITKRILVEKQFRASEEKYRNIIENNQDMIYITNLDGIFTFVSPGVKRVLGFKPSDLLNKHINKFVVKEDILKIKKITKHMHDERKTIDEFECRVVNQQKDIVWVSINASPTYDEYGNVNGTEGSLHNITKRKQDEIKIKAFQKQKNDISKAINELIQYDNIYEGISKGIKIIGQTVKADRTYFFENTFDNENMIYTVRQRIEWSNGKLTPLIKNPDLKHIEYENIKGVILPLLEKKSLNVMTKDCNQDDLKQILVDQDIKSIYITPIFIEDVFWGFIGFDDCTNDRIWKNEIELLDRYIKSIVINITKNNKFNKQFEQLFIRDQLTGLYNRKYIIERIKEIDSKSNLPIAIIMIDINGLRLVNDMFGMQEGDSVIKKIAQILKETFNKNEVVARIGGDEFGIIIPNSNTNEIYKKRDIVNKEVAKCQTEKLTIGLSFGIAIKEREEEIIDELLHEAELDMYRHKISESTSMLNKGVEVIMNALYAKSEREEQHSKRVSELVIEMGNKLGLNYEKVKQLKTVGLLHDIGKIGIDERILNSPNRLTNEEYEEIKKHAEKGYSILNSIKEFEEISKFVVAIHERYDGNGYPYGIKATDIPYESRIIAIVDAYDAMISKRTYKEPMKKEDVLEELRVNINTQFDPELTQVFIEMMS